MSAYFVEPATIDAAVTLIIRTGALMSLDEASAYGRALWTLNAEAVNALYGDQAEEMIEGAQAIAAYQWAPRTEPTAVLFKSLQCLLHNCNEGNVAEAELYLQAEQFLKVWRIAGVEKLPEYEAAPWGLCG